MHWNLLFIKILCFLCIFTSLSKQKKLFWLVIDLTFINILWFCAFNDCDRLTNWIDQLPVYNNLNLDNDILNVVLFMPFHATWCVNACDMITHSLNFTWSFYIIPDLEIIIKFKVSLESIQPYIYIFVKNVLFIIGWGDVLNW